LKNEDDIDQMKAYLESLKRCDKTFDYRVGRDTDGMVTGFVWQTGVMRKDFELNGNVLFVDRMGASKNTRCWSYHATAMLDSEKRVCLASEGLLVGESVEGYAWKIEMTFDMTPGRKLLDFEYIHVDRIHQGESMLDILKIWDTCHLMLDQKHLLDPKIGAWPNHFGLGFWQRVSEPLTRMVNTCCVQECNNALHDLRSIVANIPTHAAYVEDHIHKKRHMFAEHIICNYPGNLFSRGTQLAESNHTCVFARLGHQVETPVKLVRSLLGRCIDICAERNHWLIKNNFEATAVSVLAATSSNDRASILGLGKWGNEINQGVCRRSAKLQVEEEDGVLVYSRKDGELGYRHELNVGARECICKPCLAYCGIQCEHLLLVSGKFDLSLWHKRWHHRTHLDKCDRPKESADDLLLLLLTQRLVSLG